VLLACAPWTRWWDRNFFAQLLPWLRPVMESLIVKGVFVAMGIVTALAGMSELRGAVFGRFSEPVRPVPGQTPKA
jgi:hypothetical protein